MSPTLPLCPHDVRALPSRSDGRNPDADADVVEAARAYLESARAGVPPPGGGDAWDRFYRAYDPLVRELAAGSARPGDDPADGVQEVWALLVLRIPDFRYDPRRGPFRAWLTTLARRALADRRRRRPTENLSHAHAARLVARGPTPAEALEREEARAAVRHALAEFRRRASGTTYRVVAERWLEGRPAAETASALGLTAAQVRSRRHRALARLRRLLGENF